MKLTHGLMISALFTVLAAGCASSQPQGMSSEELAMRDRIEQSRAQQYAAPQYQAGGQDQQYTQNDAYSSSGKRSSRIK